MIDIEYRSMPPIAPLLPFVESMWMLVNRTAETKDIVVLPDGRVDILLHVSEEDPFGIFIGGLETEHSLTSIKPKSILFAVSFKLLAIEHVFANSIAPLFNKKGILPEGYWGISIDDTKDFDLFCQKMNAKILEQVNINVDSRKQKMFDLLYATEGAISVSDISAAVHWSSRQINRYFNQWFGLSLKTYCNILRFRATFPQIKEGNLFPESYFVDQAHFIKHVKRYSGFTPKELYKNKDDRFIQFSDF